jgi:hypothetical protein
MEHLSEEKRQRILDAAERCERQMALESTYVRVGDFESASLCAEAAEVDSNIAFWYAGRSA